MSDVLEQMRAVAARNIAAMQSTENRPAECARRAARERQIRGLTSTNDRQRNN